MNIKINNGRKMGKKAPEVTQFESRLYKTYYSPFHAVRDFHQRAKMSTAEERLTVTVAVNSSEMEG
jgi:hypothetical protein